MWGKVKEEVDVGKGEQVLKAFTASAQWYKEKKAAGFGGSGCVEDTPLKGLQKLCWSVFGIHPTEIVAKMCKGVAK